MNEIRFVRSWGSKARGHVTIDGETTLCGRNVSSVWATIESLDDAIPCNKCKKELARILARIVKTGQQKMLTDMVK